MSTELYPYIEDKIQIPWIIKRIICLLLGHEYEPVHRIKYTYSYGTSVHTHKRCKPHINTTKKIKYYKCSRCGKKITISKMSKQLYG